MSWSGRLMRARGGFRGTVVATGMVLAALLAACSPGVPGVSSAQAGAAAQARVPVKVITPKQPARAHLAGQAGRPFKATQTRWPAAATASAMLAAPRAGQASGSRAELAGTPLWVQSVSAGGHGAAEDAGATTQVTATVLPHAKAAPLGVSGMVFQVGGAAPSGGKVRVGLDYASFAQAYGGNFGTRLTLVELPGCALTTPQVAACRKQVPLGATQDYKGDTVSAVVPLAGPSGGQAMTYEPGSADTSAGVVLAATTSSTSGEEGAPGGTYPATKLEPAGTWSEAGDSGAFTYTYPVQVPSASTQLAPSVSLDYDSQEVDGQTATTQAQANWLGDGWATPDSSIQLETTPCADDPEGTASPTATSDECYDGEIVQMSLDGTDTPLVLSSSSTTSGVTTSTWKAADDSGDVITHVAQGSSVLGKYTGTAGSDYWTVTERDGTKYEFGLQHLPGWASGDASTNSVDTMPVYSAHSGDPCYSSSGFTSSACTMVYEWHLDWVVNTHSEAMAYFYDQTTNYYGEDNGASDVSYISDSYLDHIAYGFSSASAYATPPDIVKFTTGSRCVASTCGALSTSNSSVATQYPDVPVDLICASGTKCTSYAPSMFSEVRLESITTEQYSTSAAAYEDVDTYAFDQTEPASGDGLSPTLWLSSITRTGDDTSAGGSTSSIALPSVKFGMIDLPNRVFTSSYPGLYRYRIASITSETGGVTTVSYGTPDACSSSYSSSSSTSVTSANTDSCYPVYWTPAGETTPVLDWFESYAVTQVLAEDTTGGSLTQETDYSYGGGAAWHYDDNLAVEPKYRSWGQFRGYATVTTKTGEAANNAQAETTTSYYRGMNGDPLPSGTASVTLTDSQGGSHTDSDQLAGSALEATTYLGAGGPVQSSVITSYWISGATATMTPTQLPALSAGSITLPDLTATMTEPAETWTRTALTDGGESNTWQVTETDDTYDTGTSDANFGLLLYAYSHTDPVNSAYDSCAQYQYAPANTSENLVGLVSYTETDQVACPGYAAGSVTSVPDGLNTLTKPTGVTSSQVTKATETFYDECNSSCTPSSFSTTFPQTAAPTTGNASMTRQASGGAPGSFTWQTESQDTYDSHGRVEDAWNADGDETVTSYTLNSAGLTTGQTVDGPPTTYDNNGTTVTTDHVSSETLDPTRGLVLTSTDQNGVVTTEQYDALGRLTSVWKDGRPVADTANITYAYTVSSSGVSGVLTETLNEEGNPVPSATIYDSLGRVRQTQTLGTTPTGDGSLVTDTLYDSRGYVSEVSTNYYEASALPSVSLYDTPLNQSQDVDEYTYDGTGRQVEDTSVDEDSAISTDVTVYNGDSQTTIPGIPGDPSAGTAAVPAGAGVVQTTATNPIGRTSSLTEYTANPTLTIPSNPATSPLYITAAAGTSDATTYGYDAQGSQDKQSEGGATWTQAYNLLGQETSSTDPAGGTTTMSYDGDGDLLQSQDAEGNYTSWTYDQDGRQTAEYAAQDTSADQVPYGSTGANEIASWVYDNANTGYADMTDPDGEETTAYSYDYATSGGTTTQYEYKVQQIGYNAFGESTGELVYMPSGAPGAALGSDFIFENTYQPINGALYKQYSPAAGGLPAETVTYTTTSALDLPSAVGGLDGYADGTSYTAWSQPEQVALGSGTSEAFVTDAYDPRTGNLTSQDVTNESGAAIDSTSYNYSPAGALTSETDERNGSTSTEETQCFNYTPQGQLQQAWTATDACAATPTESSDSTVGDGLGTSSEYDEAWSFNALGEPSSKTALDPATGAFSTTQYGYSSSAPTEMTSADTTGATTSTDAYAYDADGQQDTRNAAAGDQTLCWNGQGQLTGVTTGTCSTTSTTPGTSYVYDPDGDLFSQTDGTSTTLYLPGEQITYNTNGDTESGVRFYSLPGGITAVRTGAGDDYGFEIASDQHGTNTLSLDYTAQNPTWQQFDPYGNPRGTAPAIGAFPGNRGLLNDPVDPSTSLTNIGARWYDSSTGSFISLDPLLETSSPMELNGYTYAAENPVDSSDPTGDYVYSDGGGEGGDQSCGSNGGNYTDCGGGGGGGSASDGGDPCGIVALGCYLNYTGGYSPAPPPFVPQPAAPSGGGGGGGTATTSDGGGGGDGGEECGHLGVCLEANAPVATGSEISFPLGIGESLFDLWDGLACPPWSGTGCTDGISPETQAYQDFAARHGADIGSEEWDGGDVFGGFLSGFLGLGDDVPAAACVGGDSFTPGTQVLLADGKTAAISSLKPGDKVLATSTTTGKTQAETVAAVLAHHDTDLYNLNVKTSSGVQVIHTTSNHLFWDPSLNYGWIPANHLKRGMHLKTPDGQTVVVVGGSTPAVHDGWMWDLTVPGNNDHDFYVIAAMGDSGSHAALAGPPVLVHNDSLGCSTGGVYTLRDEAGNVVRTGRSSNLAAREAAHFNDPVLGQFEFQVEYRTDVYAEQRGLEQMLYDQYPQAQAANGGYNMIRGIGPLNPNGPGYMQAADSYLQRLTGGG